MNKKTRKDILKALGILVAVFVLMAILSLF